ncbi:MULTISPECIES: PLD nuclease N-terminal domain-containing protein [unclassified Curtobacterium]|uniref:PLD nuclease N-terminal domain-containing protein n=1 Tax=unclassified Curtobacterium TaxID=257496 RepID=UPI000DA9F83E|nr:MULTISPECIES: PLD nuclease N-terminal domain-containing protein [unclassified Curtobacterium]PZE26535.1 hypothetical protein DEI86_08695 [Curtobacterium sp. MCBD17_028]PZF58625.1 hypothetical protein DEI92_11300 [Curtobacterium sp. MCBD17_034]PZF64325.1 hypothetical protein DEI81_04970 [Curtobacterium sp. MCBD17_013]PZM34615.1 hypothetical protein DEI90_07870 [Curtobacterium sp. MCBD17_031]WIB62695.1 PLD nuclease N-terminal domain-containing protein [Curtobacterium sp. MCBD17_040]
MVKFLIGAVVAAVAFTVYAVIDCAWVPRDRVRALNKPLWIVLVVVLPIIGAVLWYLLGRAPARAVPRQRYRGPDDDPDFLGATARAGMTRSEKEQSDATLRHLEQQLADLDDDPGASGGPGGDRPDR